MTVAPEGFTQVMHSGLLAGEADMPRNANPHDQNSLDWFAWDLGWAKSLPRDEPFYPEFRSRRQEAEHVRWV